MAEPRNAASRTLSGEQPDYRVDDKGVPLWSEPGEEMASGRNLSTIFVFVFVPLMAVAALVFCLYALFAHLFGMPQT
jgi:hypothetical protein